MLGKRESPPSASSLGTVDPHSHLQCEWSQLPLLYPTRSETRSPQSRLSAWHCLRHAPSVSISGLHWGEESNPSSVRGKDIWRHLVLFIQNSTCGFLMDISNGGREGGRQKRRKEGREEGRREGKKGGSSHTKESPCEDTVRGQPSVNQGGRCHQKETCQTLIWDLWPPELWRNTVLLFKPVYGICFREPDLIDPASMYCYVLIPQRWIDRCTAAWIRMQLRV